MLKNSNAENYRLIVNDSPFFHFHFPCSEFVIFIGEFLFGNKQWFFNQFNEFLFILHHHRPDMSCHVFATFTIP